MKHKILGSLSSVLLINGANVITACSGNIVSEVEVKNNYIFKINTLD